MTLFASVSRLQYISYNNIDLDSDRNNFVLVHAIDTISACIIPVISVIHALMIARGSSGSKIRK